MRSYSASVVAIIGRDGSPVGTGVVIDRRRVLTCAHVVSEALGSDNQSKKRPAETLRITVPLRVGGEESFGAVVSENGWLPATADPLFGIAEDVAILELADLEEFPQGIDSARLASVDLRDDINRNVAMTGFRGGSNSDRITGLICGIDDRGRLQIDPENDKREVSGGFSGAGVLDIRTGCIVAILITKRQRGQTTVAYGLPISTIVRAIELPVFHPEESVLALPSLPRNFVGREVFLEKLRRQVLTGRNAGVVTSRPTALKGMGGLGKSVLAKALMHDAEIAAAFGPERYWITLGTDKSPIDAQMALLKAITNQRVSVEHVSEGRAELRRVLADKPRLITLDDVWTAEQIAAFEDLGTLPRFVITTRRADVIQKIGAEPIPLDVLDHVQSRELLSAWAGLQRSQDLPDLADEVITECGALPLAIAIFGAAISASDLSWKDGLDALRDRDLTDLKRPIEGYQDNQGVFGAIALSFSTLSIEDRNSFARCAIFPEDQSIPFSAFAALWHDLPFLKLKPRLVRQLCRRLEDASLMTRDAGTEVERWKIHDLVKDYLYAILEDVATTHQVLADGYLLSKVGSWTEFADDGYALDWLPHHLKESNLPGDKLLRDTLLDCDWLQAKQSARNTRLVISDLNLLRDDEAAFLVAGALRLSAYVLDVDPMQLPAQLLGRLEGRVKTDRLESLLAAARTRLPSDAMLPRASGYLLGPGLLRETLAGPYDSIDGVQLLSDRRRALSWSEHGKGLRLWNVDTGESKGFGEESPLITAATLLPDERYAISSHHDGSLRLWDLKDFASRLFEEHNSWAYIVHVFKDGRRVLSRSTDGTLKLWNCFKFRVTTLEGHESGVSGAIVFEDERRILSWSSDNTLRLWDIETGDVRVFEGHTDWVNGARLLSPGSALSWSNDLTLRLWDLNTGKARIFKGHNRGAKGHEISKDRKVILFYNYDGSLNLWNLETGEARSFSGHRREVTGVQFLMDDKRALSWSSDYTLRLWDLKTGEAQVFEGHRRAVNGAKILRNEQDILSWSKDSTLRLWNIKSGASQALEAHRGSVNGAHILSEGGRALSWSNDGSLRIWDLSKAQPADAQAKSSPVYGTKISSANRQSVSCLADGSLQLMQIDTGDVISLRGHTAAVHGIELTGTGGQALSWSKDGSLISWDLNTMTGRPFKGHRSAVAGAKLLDGGRRALSWSKDGTLRLWELETGTSLIMEGHRGPVSGAKVLGNGVEVLSWSKDGNLRLWDLSTGDSRAFTGHVGPINGALFLNDEQTLISWSKDGTIRRWDLRTGISRVYEGHLSSVIGVRIPPSGRQFLSWSGDSKMRLWEMESGLSRVLHDGGYGGIGAELSNQGHRILCWTDDGLIRLWNVGESEPNLLHGHSSTIKGVKFLGDGRRVLSWSTDSTLKLWDLDRRSVIGNAILDTAPSDVAVSDDDRIAIIGDGNGRILTFDLPTN